ncbi:MAG: hypothetical protein P8163_14190 [Candidatus Thiodiazotropha sp.]
MNASTVFYYGSSLRARIQGITRSWRCRDKLLVFESDDWGAIRTSTPLAYEQLLSNGYPIDRSFWHLDALETDDDMTALYEVLNRYRDIRGCPACFTGNIIMANPNFEKILNSNYQHYYFENVAKTFERSSMRRGVPKLWKEGLESKIFRPQLHAREHVKWWDWLLALKEGSREALETFDLNMSGVEVEISKEGRSYFEPIYINSCEIDNFTLDIDGMVRDGFEIFESVFGYKSLSTIAPFCAWTDKVEQIWIDLGVKYIQGGYCQQVVSDRGVAYIPHYLGERSKYGSIYLVRNCNFEPASNQKQDVIGKTLSNIKMAFMLGIPAIISTHRVNYIGTIRESNRNRGLSQLSKLLAQVLKTWPDVNFVTSAELGCMIENGLHRVTDLQGLETDIYPTVKPNLDK